MNQESLVLSLTILTTSFFGSWHCAGMCGPIASILAQRNQLIQYHITRFIIYVLFGAMAGALGAFFLGNSFNLLRLISAWLFGLVLIYMGIKNLDLPLLRRIIPQSTLLKKVIAQIQAFKLNQPGWLIGALTILLPCGWLYTYIIAAVASKSPYAGAFIMALFFAGGLPALIAMPWMIKKTIQKSDTKQKKIAGGILILAGIYSLISFYLAH